MVRFGPAAGARAISPSVQHNGYEGLALTLANQATNIPDLVYGPHLLASVDACSSTGQQNAARNGHVKRDIGCE